MIVTLHIQLSQDGSLIKAGLARDESRYASDRVFRASADAAIRAVTRCSPLKNLPIDKFGTWGDLELTFDPSKIL